MSYIIKNLKKKKSYLETYNIEINFGKIICSTLFPLLGIIVDKKNIKKQKTIIIKKKKKITDVTI